MIPVWGGYTERLPAAMSSLRAQDQPFRIIVVDNASDTPLPALGEAVRVIRAPGRLSLGAARNLGLAEVDTTFVIFWDADDVMMPGALERLEAAIQAEPGLVLCGMAIRESPSGARHRWPRQWLGRLVRFPRLLALLHCVWSQFPTTGAAIMRSDAARAGGGFPDADSGEDWCLGASIAFRGRIGWSEEFGREYHLYPQSVWARHMTTAHQREHARAVRRRVREDRGVPGWARSLLPLICLGQYAALGGHALVVMARRRDR